MPEWLQILFGSISLLMMIFMFFLGRYFLKRDGEAAQRVAIAEEAQVLILTGLLVGGELNTETAIAVRDGKTNGSMERALARQEIYNGKLSDFIVKNSKPIL